LRRFTYCDPVRDFTQRASRHDGSGYYDPGGPDHRARYYPRRG